MNISAPFIRRPIMTTLLSVGILALGVVAYGALPVSELPNVDFPVILVTGALPGASPETMASSVATPLEREFSTISGLSTMTSSSSLGSTQITLQFDLSRNIDSAAQDVGAAISRAALLLPPTLPTPPTYRKVNPADQPILYLALTSSTLPLYRLDEYGETLMAQRISTVSGVAQVVVFGAQKYAVRVQLDPDQLAVRGIGLDQVSQAVQAANPNLPTGDLQGRHQAATVQATGQLFDAAAYNQVVVAYRNNAPVRVQDVGRAIDGVQNDRTGAWYNGRPAVVLAVQRQPGTNTVAVANRVTKLIPEFRREIPGSVSLDLVYDRSQSIRASVHDVKVTLLITLVLVVAVIFLFLRSVRAAAIPSVALPMSILGTFGVMYLLGFSLDNLSLMALTLSVGFVVDDAIVMLENIVRHGEMGEARRAAALSGSAEIGFTIVSMTVSLVAVFIPILFMGGVVGRLFREFSIVIATAILLSGLASLTLTPMLCSRYLKTAREEAHRGRLFRASERVFDAGLRFYDRTLRWAVRRRLLTMVVVAVVLVLMVLLFRTLPKGFIPAEDQGQIFSPTQAAEGISWESMKRHQAEVAAAAQADPAVAGVVSAAGAGGGLTGVNSGIVFLHLRPRSERVGVDEVIARLRRRFARVVGISAYPQNLPPLRVGGQLTQAQYQYTLVSDDTRALYQGAPVLEARMRALPGLRDVTSDLHLANPQITARIDRNRAASLGVSAAAVESALALALAQSQVSTIYAPNNEYQVILELEPWFRRDASGLSRLYVRASGQGGPAATGTAASVAGPLVPLSAVTTSEPGVAPLTVNHTGQRPSVTISFNLDPSTSLGTAVAEVDRASRGVLPPSVSTRFQGTAQAFQSSLSGLGVLLLMAVLVIYVVLGVLYESFVHPVTILSALPFAGFGALLALWVFGIELSLYAFVGIIMLVGLVKKNGIMMVDFAVAARAEGKDAEAAILDACHIRFRPIMMTTMAALFGTLPIALAVGAGAEARRPLGVAVVGGLLFSQLFTLYVTPVFYLYMDQLEGWLSRKRPRAETSG